MVLVVERGAEVVVMGGEDGGAGQTITLPRRTVKVYHFGIGSRETAPDTSLFVSSIKCRPVTRS